MKKLYAERRQFFPDPRSALIDGIVAVDNMISTEVLLEAYSFGIFPWPQEDFPILWFSPPRRGVIDFKSYKPQKSFLKWLKRTNLQVTCNRNFAEVLEGCRRSPRPGQDGTWIDDRIKEAYIQFHKDGYAHSFECWDDNKLVGGLYGVYVGGVFCGESMFFLETNASKLCLHRVIELLKQNGKTWMDVQMITPYIKSVGGHYISRDEFLNRLEEAKSERNLITWGDQVCR